MTRFAPLAPLLLLVGCTYSAEFTMLPQVNQAALTQLLSTRAARAPAQVEVLEEAPAHRPYVMLGTLKAPSVGWTKHYTMAALVAVMKERAAEAGADAVVNIQRTPGSTTLHISGEAIIFVKKGEREKLLITDEVDPEELTE